MENTLANTLRMLGASAAKTEAQAAILLAFVHRHRLTTAPRFARAVRQAYADNGWNSGRGRPKAGTAAQPVPRAVRQYVHEVRAALLARINLAQCSTFYELRKALAEHKAREHGKHTPAKAPELKGVALTSPGKLTGGLFHDLATVYDGLRPGEREHMQASLARLLAQYTAKPRAAFLRPIATDEAMRKAA